MDFLQIHHNCKEQTINGRYIHLKHIETLLLNAKRSESTQILGKSVHGKPIYGYQIGSGFKRILMWSQMHGNESTTTKALFDLFNFLDSNEKLAQEILAKCTLFFVPILNPDGAELYTRENANGVDLNRDAKNLSQPESIILRDLYNSFNPDYCFNLHDQRTIYGVGNTDKSAVVSLLAPSFDSNRNINLTRQAAIEIASSMNSILQNYIPNQVGRYDDNFNDNCVGDTFQALGTPTILVESGHIDLDYQREFTRKYVFIALLSSLLYINENDVVTNKIEEYLNIPQNKTSFFDIVYKNIVIDYDNTKITTNFAIQFIEELLNNTIYFNAFIVEIGKLENCVGHQIFDAAYKQYSDSKGKKPTVNQAASFNLDNLRIVNGTVVSS